MPTGLKTSSGQIIISGQVTESAANTYTQEEVDLQLNVLDREVFVVTALDLNVSCPEIQIRGADVSSRGCLSTTSRSSIGSIANSNVLGSTRITAEGHAGGLYVISDTSSLQGPPTNMDYMGIISTNNFFAGLKGDGNTNEMKMDYRLYGYRARATADVYAALVQSELLSADA